jgi:sirohydrochlorin ferrochelatase
MYVGFTLPDKRRLPQSRLMSARGILLVDHGSRNAAANETLAAIAKLVEARRGGAAVAFAHMELAAPTISEAIATLVARGVTEIVVVPYFLAPGRHSTEDIPRMIDDAMRAHPSVAHRMAPPLGVDELLAELVIKRSEG